MVLDYTITNNIAPALDTPNVVRFGFSHISTLILPTMSHMPPFVRENRQMTTAIHKLLCLFLAQVIYPLIHQAKFSES